MPIRIGTLNCNGLRAAHRKGLADLIQAANCDVLLLQEIRTHSGFDHRSFLDPSYHIIANPASQPGYSGTLIAYRLPLSPSSPVFSWPGLPLCDEGRLIDIQMTPELRVVNFYWPSGGEEHRQALKIQFLEALALAPISYSGVLCVGGDFNIAQTDQDLKNFRGNKEKPGCTRQERTLIASWLQTHTLGDTYRHLHDPCAPEEYTWWSYRQKAFDKNVGWRIDTLFLSQPHLPLCQSYGILSEPRVSDHALYWVDIAL